MKIIIIALMLTIFCSSEFLFACTDKDINITATAGENGSVLQEEKDGDKYFIASPNEWFTFTGWYDGYRKYSDNPRLKVTKNTPDNLEAKFATSGTLTFDRILNSFYNSYKLGFENEGNYFNYDFKGQLIYKENSLSSEIKYDARLNGQFNCEDRENLICFQVDKNQDEIATFAYREMGQEGYLYLNLDGQKQCYGDMGLLSNILHVLPTAGEEVWKCENLLGQMFYQFDRCFGLMNDYGFVESVTNTNDKSLIVISFQKVLNTLKNFYPTIKDDSLKTLADVLIGEYSTETFPRIAINIEIMYKGEELEQIDKISIKSSLSKDYRLNFNGRIITIPKGEIDFNLNSLDMGFVQTADNETISKLETYPKQKQNMVNFRLGGHLSFLAENTQTTTVDRYKVEVNADINPLAMVSFKGQNYQDVEWEKFGFLNVRAVLDLDGLDEAAAKEALGRHKNSTDYINILIDSKRFGGKVIVYAAFYDPATLLSKSYFFNNSFDIASLLKENDNQSRLNETANGEGISLNSISNIIKTMLDVVSNFDELNVNKSIYDLIVKYFGESLTESLIFQNEKISLNLSEVREKIRNIEKANGLVLDGDPIKTDRYLFGSETITKLELDFEELQIGSALKDSLGNYLDNNGNSIVEDFNSKHLAVIEVKSVGGLESLSVDEIFALKGTEIVADKVILSDGFESETYLANNGSQEQLKLLVQNVEIVKQENGHSMVELTLQINAPLNKPNLLNINFTQAFNRVFGMDYGVYSFTFEIDLA